MKKTGTQLVRVALLAILLFTACNSAAKTEESTDTLLTKEQYVAGAKDLVDKLIEIVGPVNDSESAAKAIEECNKLKPKAEQLSKSAKALIKPLREDQEARNELTSYFQENCPQDSDLEPLSDKLGNSLEDSKYPELLKTVGEMIKTAMHNNY